MRQTRYGGNMSKSVLHFNEINKIFTERSVLTDEDNDLRAVKSSRDTGRAGDASSSDSRLRFGHPGRTTRILLVEDDRPIADTLSRTLEVAGFTAFTTGLGEDALDLARTYRFDLILLDLSLPDMSGQLVLQKLRTLRPDTPIILLSNDTDVSVKVEGLLEGADDYVTKPFHRDELLARIHVMLRRVHSTASSDVTIGPLTLDFSTRRATSNGQRIPLTAKEYSCLEFLVQRRGTTVTKEMFLTHLYDGRDEPEMKIIDVFVCKIRRKLADAGVPPIIETVWGRGYTIPFDAGDQ